jgi:hypothetical protein
MERCPSGLRGTPGKRVCVSRTLGSNPSLSVKHIRGHTPMSTLDNEDFLTAMHPQCRVTIIEARELSWRKFYHDAGGLEGIARIDGTDELGKHLNASEDCFLKIIENTISEEELKNLINLTPTNVWVDELNNIPITLKETKA